MKISKIKTRYLLIHAAILSLLLFDYCAHNDEDESQRYPSQNQPPSISLLSEPFVRDVSTSQTHTRPKNEKFKVHSPTLKAATLPLEENSFINVTIDLQVTNEGPAVANILLFVSTDTLVEIQDLREFLLGDLSHLYLNYRVNVIATDDMNLLLPERKNSLHLDFIHTLKFKSGKPFKLHYLIVYEDENGTIYDTYFWAAYRFRNIRDTGVVYFNGRSLHEKPFLYKELSVALQDKDVIYLNHSGLSHHVYDASRGQNIRKRILNLSKLLAQGD
ncbi:MAG: hypothetical protein ACE5HS_12995 [bacterium]